MESPTRARTEDEKGHLQSLNKRLEFYILQQREKDASTNSYQRELDAQREKAEEQLRNARKWHLEQVDMLRAQRAETEDALAQKSLDNSKLVNQIDGLNHELNKEKAFAQSLLKKIRQLTEDNSAVRQQLFGGQQENAELRTSLESEKKRTAGLDEELKASLEANQTLRERLSAEHRRAMDLEDNLAQESIRRRDAEAIKLGLEESQRILQARLNDEDPVQRAAVQRQLAAMQVKCDALLRDNIEHLEQLNEEKLAGYRDELEKKGHECGLAKQQLDRAKRDLTDKSSRIAELTRIHDDLLAKIAQLEKDLRAARAEPAAILAEKGRVIAHLKDEFKRKDKLFNDLMDVKIPFDLELKHLEELLASEEGRLGLSGYVDPELVASPPKKKRAAPTTETSSVKKKLRSSKVSKKRKSTSGRATARVTRSSSSRNVVAEPVVEEADATAPPPDPKAVLVSQRDEDGDYLVLQNTTSTALNTMQGWKLLFSSSNRTFAFPDVPFNADDKFIIRMSDEFESDDSRTGVAPSGTWNSSKDHSFLQNPDGEMVAEFDIESQDTADMSDDSTCTMM